MAVFLEQFDSNRVVTKAVNTQLVQGKFNPSTGSNIDVKRPHDYNAIRTSDGDISNSTKSDIISGKATATVQNYITVATEWGNVEEALELNQLEQILAPMARRAVITAETAFAAFMVRNCNLSYGTPGSAVSAWGHVAGASALMESIGVPMDKDWHYIMSPYTKTGLADVQRTIGTYDAAVKTAWDRAQLTQQFGNMRVSTATSLAAITNGTMADRAGTVDGNPVVTYVAHKDTMIQSIGVTGFSANGVIKAGEVVEITGRYYINQSTRVLATGADGVGIKFRGVVTEDVTLDSSGEGTIKIAGPAIYEANGQYNTTSSAVVSGDVITVLGTSAATVKPNLFFHPDAFTFATVRLPKLFATDTIGETEDGISIRVTKYSDGDANTQKVRFDLLPAHGALNPFFAGLGYGVAS